MIGAQSTPGRIASREAGGGLSLRYEPPGPVAAGFMADRGEVAAIMGPVGSGKTTACIFKLLFAAAAQRPSPVTGARKTRWATIRNTYPELKTTTIKSWHQWVPETAGHWQAEGPPTHTVGFSMPSGKMEVEVMFLALDRPEDVRKLLSMELSGAWVNEAREIPRSILDLLTTRIGRYPPLLHGGPTLRQIIMDTNPPDDDSEFYKLFEEERPAGYRLHRQPGGRTARAENTQNLEPGYYDRISRGKPADFIKVYVDGQYGHSRDGKPVFPEFDDSIHVASAPIAPVPGLPLILGLDAGLTPAAVIKQRLPDGQWRALDEIVSLPQAGIGANRFGAMINRVLAERYAGFEVAGAWADPSAAYGADKEAGEKSWIETVEAVCKFPVLAAPSNELLLRLEAVRVPLGLLIDGRKPAYLLSPACRTLRKAYMSGYCYRRLQIAGKERYEDKPDKNEYSHVADADQYAMLGGGELAEVMGRGRQRAREPEQVRADSSD